MAVQELVLIDTCIWVQFFNRPQSRDKKAVDALLDDDRAPLIGPILAEILLGFRRDAQADGSLRCCAAFTFFKRIGTNGDRPRVWADNWRSVATSFP